MRGHDFLYDIEAQPGAARFRGIQRLKNLGVVLRGNAAAGIPHVELGRHPLPSPMEREGPPLGHGVSRVVHEVEPPPPEGRLMHATWPSGARPASWSVIPCAARAGVISCANWVTHRRR